jgi:hypothetical protein
MQKIHQLLARFGAAVTEGHLVRAADREAVQTALQELDNRELDAVIAAAAEATESVDTSHLAGKSAKVLTEFQLLVEDLRAEQAARPAPDPAEQAADIVARLRASDEEVPEAGEQLAASAPMPVPARVPSRHQPRERMTRPELVLRASGGDASFSDDADLARAIYEAADQTRRGRGADGETQYIATVDWSHAYDGRPRVRADASAADNGTVLHQVAQEFIDQRRALTASGGVPGPGMPKYDIPTWGTAERPIRAALPVVLASRGIVNWNTPPTIEDFVVDTSNAAINFASSSTDASGGSYKTVQEISAVTPASATVEAQILRLQHGNFADKFLPELMVAWMKNGQVRYARHNDARRIAEISAGSTHYTDTPAVFGAWRDFKRQVLAVTEELEDRLRDPNLPIRILVPEYISAMLAADLSAQQPGDNVWGVTEDDVRARLNSLDPNVTFTFFYDGGQTHQRLLTSPTAGGRTPGFDADVDWYCFPEGTWAFLDGGTLDLGIVRDSTLNAQNRFQTFSETWEVCAKIGVFSYHITSSLCSGGGSQAASDVAKCSPQGS